MYTELRYSYCPAVFNVASGVIDIDVSPYLKDVLLAVETDTEVEAEVETDAGVDNQALAARLMDAQDELVKVFGDSLKYEFDQNEHIAGIDVSLA